MDVENNEKRHGKKEEMSDDCPPLDWGEK